MIPDAFRSCKMEEIKPHQLRVVTVFGGMLRVFLTVHLTQRFGVYQHVPATEGGLWQ